MSPRPRKPGNGGLPANLYPNGKYYRYRRPDDGTWHQMGTDKAKAIQAARTLNTRLTVHDDLTGRVMGAQLTLAAFIVVYQTEILPPRKLAKATLDLYAVRLRQIVARLGSLPVDGVTIAHVAAYLDSLSARSSNQTRAILADVFAHAVAKGLCPDNPAALTIPRIEEVARKRHTLEGLMAIRAEAEGWLQNAIDLALVTAQRRGDILAMRFDDVRDGYLHVIQHKTARSSDAGYLRILVTQQRKAVIDRCRDNVPSPYLIHRKPERTSQAQQKGKAHWTKIEEGYLSRAFKAAREKANAYPGLTDAQQPGFHEIRALAIHLMKKAGKDAQGLAGQADQKTTKNYLAGHDDIIWTEVDDEVVIREIAG